jgi:hypothetical protein
VGPFWIDNYVILELYVYLVLCLEILELATSLLRPKKYILLYINKI